MTTTMVLSHGAWGEMGLAYGPCMTWRACTGNGIASPGILTASMAIHTRGGDTDACRESWQGVGLFACEVGLLVNQTVGMCL